MASTMYISIPCTYENKVLTVKALGFEAKGDSPDQALLECIKSTPLYIPLMLAKFKSFTDHNHRSFQQFEVPFDNAILKKINEVEPYPEEKTIKKKSKSVLSETSAEDVIKYGY